MNFTLKKSDLNFKVYTVAAKPTAPGAENDIAIISSVPMSNWLMSPEKPSGIPRNNGDVWVQYSTQGYTKNILKQNTMMIATISAWQYIDGVWVRVDAMIYQDGGWTAFARLPSEYQEVEFLQATGTQYIRSPLFGKLNMMRFELGVNTTGTGACVGYNKAQPYFFLVDGSRAILNTDGSAISGATIPANTYIEVERFGDASGQITVKLDGEQLVVHNIGSSHASYNYTANNVMLFGSLKYDNSVGSLFKGKLYYFRVYDTDYATLLYDFVPCYRKADSVAGLFDMVNKTFYSNSGSGTFIVGGDR